MSRLYGAGIKLDQTIGFTKEAPLDNRAAVLHVSDIHLLPSYPGLMTYVADEDANYQYRIIDGVKQWKKLEFGQGEGKGTNITIGENNHWWIDGVDSGIAVSQILYIGTEEPEEKHNVVWLDPSRETEVTNSGEIYNIKKNLGTLERLVAQLMKIIKYGAIAGDSTVGGRTSILEESDVAINPNDPDDTGAIEPDTSGMTVTVPNLVVKCDTGANFYKNKLNLLDGEIIWLSDKGALYIYIDGAFKAIGSSVAPGENPGEEDNDNDNDDMTQEQIEALYFTSLGLEDTQGNQYRVKVNNEGNVIVYDASKDYENNIGNIGDYGSYVSDYLKINSVFFGGEGTKIDSFCAATHNFVELANGDSKDINLNGLYLLYFRPSTGKWEPLALLGTIPAGGTFLVRGAQCSVKSNTNVAVDSYDMIWYVDNKPIEFSLDGGSIYLAVSVTDTAVNGDKEVKLYTDLSTKVNIADFPNANPYKSSATTIPLGYIDLMGINNNATYTIHGEGNTIVMSTSGSRLLDCLFFRQYSMDATKATVKAIDKRKTATFWTYIDVTKASTDPYPYFTEDIIQKAAPKASYQHKTFATSRSEFVDKTPNCVNVTFGKLATETVTGTTGNGDAVRCFNWVSVGYYDEFVEVRPVGTANWTRKHSITVSNANTDYNGDTVVSTFIQVYKRFRWVTIGGMAVTTHKAIVRGLGAGTYEFRIGREGDSSYSYEGTFSVLNDTLAASFKFVLTTDLLGFNFNEYLAWEKTAYVIALEEGNLAFAINTGDMSLSGNRESEWIDYYKAKRALGNLVEMPVIGNNDLCGAKLYLLGKGTANTQKINSKSIWLYYCFDLDVNNPAYFTFKWTASLVASKLGDVISSEDKSFTYFVPSLYSFNFGKYHFIALNSEFNTNYSGTYTLYYNDTAIQTPFKLSSYYSQYKWLLKDYQLYGTTRNCIAYAHEIPFCIVPGDDTASYVAKKRDFASDGQSKLNQTFENGPAYTNIEDTTVYKGGGYFSQFFQEHNIKLVLGGHKHTYSLSYPIKETIVGTGDTRTTFANYPLRLGYTLYTKTGANGDQFQLATEAPEGFTKVVSYDEIAGNPVVYGMCLASGYKLESNNDKPGIGISWLLAYFPYNAGGSLNTGLQYPMYTAVECTGNTVTMTSYNATEIYDHSGASVVAFNINKQLGTPVRETIAGATATITY